MITIRISTSDKVGSCSACNANITPRGMSNHRVRDIELSAEGSRQSQSFRLCDDCRLEMLNKLKAT